MSIIKLGVRLCVRTLFIALVFMQLSYAQLSPKDDHLILTALAEYQQAAVLVEFEDEAVGRDIARGFEPLKTRFSEGYIILVLDDEEYGRLSNSVDSMPVKLSYHSATMERYIIPKPAESLSQAELFSRLNDAVMSNSFNGTVYPSIPGFACYRTVEGTYSTASDIAAAFPNLATWSDVGDSWEKTVGSGGYDIQALTLTNSATTGTKPAILLTGGIHAREYTPVELLTRFAEHLVTSYGNDADVTWILDNHIVHMILIANPDGRKRAETGLLWRKNVNENYCGATSNNRGADLNRNFQFAWNCCGGSSSNQCNQTYHGPFAASEPETQAVQNFLISNFNDNRGPALTDAAPADSPGMFIDIHSSGQLVLWPWGFSSAPPPNGTALTTLGRKMAFPNNHSPEQAATSFTTDGETDSFGYGELGLASYTFELGTEFFEACSFFESTIVPDNFESLMYALKVLRTPYITPAGPDTVNLSLEFNTAIPSGTPVAITATADDTRFNNSNGTEPTQSISNAEYYIDVPPWDAGANGIALNAGDGSFNANVESITGTIDTSGLSVGRHTIYVRAQDSNNTWGAVSAVFLDIDNTVSVPVTLFSDDFESELGWTTNAAGTDTATTGQWERGNPEQVVLQGAISQLGTSNSGVNNLVTGRLAGTSAGTFDIDNGVTSIRSPDIVIPANAQSVNLSLAQYFYHFSNSNASDFLTISVVGTSTSVVLDERGAASVRAAQWAPFNVDISSFAGQTIHLLIEAADAGGGSLVEAGIDDVIITAIVPSATNQAPTSNAGVDQTITLPDSANLNGSASDDDLPSNTLTTLWSLVSGPGTATFANANSTTTSVSFSTDGVYVLRLSADDGELSASDDITITVNPEPPVNQVPIVNAGLDQTVELPNSASLNGTASDDGLPSNSLSVNWSQLSGPGSVSFGNANSTVTSASFSTDGIYVLRLTANDGELSASDDITITVNPEPPVNQAPTVNAGVDQTIDLPDSASLTGSANDDGLPSNNLTVTWSQLSGPDVVTFGDANSVNTSASFTMKGTYLLRLTASDGELSTSDEVTIIVNPPAPTNQAPSVNAGADQTIDLPNSASLNGSVTDDGLPSNTLTVTWTQLSGPGVVSFANANSATTTASFSADGVYVLRLTGSDGALSSSDDITLIVNPQAPVNQAPSVNAGADQSVELPNSASLNGNASDDGLPSNNLSTTWSQLSGPGVTSFANAASLTTTASFSADGVYVLRLTASDGVLESTDDLTVTVSPQPPVNTAPTVSAGSDQVVTLPDAVTLSGTASDDGLPNGVLNTNWSLVSGPGTVNFADASSTATSATFSIDGVYVLRLTASDTVLSSSDDVSVTVNPAPASNNFETLSLSNVSSAWQTVSLSNSYTNAVAVCTPQYANTSAPAVTRIRNIGSDSFELRVQNPSDSAITVISVSCMVMEEGSWTLPDGRLIEAQSYNSSRTDNRSSWVGDSQSYLNSYTNPVVLGQVMSANDADWSSFWSRGSSRGAVPNSSTLFTGKNVAEDNDTTRANETVGFIVIQAGSGNVGGSDYRVALGADTIQGSTNGVRSYNFSSAFSSTPAFAIASQSAMDGNNGGWAYLRGAGALSSSSITLAIDEDQIRDSERAHTTEQVAYFVSENQLSIQLTPNP